MMNIRILSFVVFGMLAAAYPAAVREAGDRCKPRSVFCADGDGVSPRYLKCVHERLVEGFCPHDSICVGSKDVTVFCAIEHSNNVTYAHPHSIPPPPPPPRTLNVAAHQPQEPHVFVPASKPPALMFASKTDVQQQQQQLVVPTQRVIGSLDQPTPAHAIQDANMKPMAPVSQGIQSKPHDQPLFAATSSANFNNAVKAVPSQLGNAPTTVPETQNHNNLQRPRPANILQIPARATMVGPPHALQKGSRFNSAPAQSLIGGIEADRVLSVVGGILFSQLAQPTAAAADSAVTSSAVEPQQHSLASSVSDMREAEANTMSQPDDSPPPVDAAPTNNPPALLSQPQPQPPAVCNPGSFVCAMHGQSVGYYACDAGGFALPATCGPNEVCYQYGQSILCGAPGGAPRVNALLK